MTLNCIEWAQILGPVIFEVINPDGHVTLIIKSLFRDGTEDEKI